MRGADGSALFVLGGLMATVAELIVKIGANFGGLVKGFDTASTAADKWAKDFKKTASDYSAIGKGMFETGDRMAAGLQKAGNVIGDVTNFMDKLGNVSTMTGKDLVSFSAATLQMGGSVLMLAGSMPNLIQGLNAMKASLASLGPAAAVAGTAFASWELGTYIRDATGLGAALDSLFPPIQALADANARYHEENQRIHADLATQAKLNDELAKNKMDLLVATGAVDAKEMELAAHFDRVAAAHRTAAEAGGTNAAAEKKAAEEAAKSAEEHRRLAVVLADVTKAEALAEERSKRWAAALEEQRKAAERAADSQIDSIGGLRDLRNDLFGSPDTSEYEAALDKLYSKIEGVMTATGELGEAVEMQLAGDANRLAEEFGVPLDKIYGDLKKFGSAGGAGGGGPSESGKDSGKADADKAAAEAAENLAQTLDQLGDMSGETTEATKKWREGVDASTAALKEQVFSTEQAVTGFEEAIDILSTSMNITGDSIRELAPDVQGLDQMMQKLTETGHKAIGVLGFVEGTGMMVLAQVNESNIRYAQAMQALATETEITSDWMQELTAGLQAATDATKPIDIFAKAADDAAASAAGTADALDALTRSVSPSGGSAGGQSAASRGVGLGGAVGPAAGLPGLFRGLLGRRGGALGGAGASVSSDAAAGPSGVSAQPVVVVASEAAKRPLNVYLQMSNGTLKAVFADMIDEDRGANIQSRI